MHQPEQTVSVAQAADILGESRWTTLRRIHAGTLAAYKLGGNGTSPWVLNRVDVEALAAEDGDAA